MLFHDAGYLPFWIYGGNFGITYKEYLVVFITVNLVGIASVVLIIQYKTWNILCVWLENSYLCFFGNVFWGKSETFCILFC